MATPTIGSVATVTAARVWIDIVQRRTPRSTETAPQAIAKPARLSTHSMCSCEVPGSACMIRPMTPVAIHISPEVRSGSGPSS